MEQTIPPTEVKESAASARNGRNWPIIIGGLVVGLLIGLGAMLAFGVIGPREFHGMVIQSPHPVDNFTLTTANNDDVTLRDFRGKVVMLYFGYTYCPDVCPATSSELKQAMAELGDRAKDVQVIMVSVDPERDTPDDIDEYAKYFNPTFIGVTGTEAEILAATTPLGIYYQAHEGSAATGYLVDHTATVTLIDKEGYIRVVYPFGTTGSQFAEDLRYFVRK